MSSKIGAALGKAALTAALSLALMGTAAAASFQITTQSSGTGLFDLDGMFTTAGPEGHDLPYTLRTTTTLSDPALLHSSANRTAWQDNDASVQVDLEVGGVHYQLAQTNRYVMLDYHADVGGAAYNVLNLYVDLRPYSTGNSASLSQAIALPQGLLPFDATMTPVALSSPDILRGWVEAGIYYSDDVFSHQLGSAIATPQNFSYTLVAVPEPGTYAMTLLGCAVLAGAGALRARAADESRNRAA
ncbi:putative secreted protein with PEP-CTERM sorting signal [Pseudoduganella flava]|uniref:PEP-CTERM sorting domain-containing protein n=1 Tax=Pseudoduganella flava TaxID=871742 RepID=A0A562PII1_9BURK|nr:PEP-CTERM sorting domain-containing protein [Pseudoduganella flava]QGZ42647.1 PEP-CTERM sorting domain-containing protein [Pseudoduganella flava]TWI43806.1 putative secreted protein with PEP-CTERM sorting signal [Pseudoduganella flava]